MVTALVSTSKPASARETSLATMRSACFFSRLARRARDDVLGLGGEADEQRSVAGREPPRAEVAEDVRRLLQHERERVVASFDTFCGGRSTGA